METITNSIQNNGRVVYRQFLYMCTALYCCRGADTKITWAVRKKTNVMQVHVYIYIYSRSVKRREKSTSIMSVRQSEARTRFLRAHTF